MVTEYFFLYFTSYIQVDAACTFQIFPAVKACIWCYLLDHMYNMKSNAGNWQNLLLFVILSHVSDNFQSFRPNFVCIFTTTFSEQDGPRAKNISRMYVKYIIITWESHLYKLIFGLIKKVFQIVWDYCLNLEMISLLITNEQCFI
jgi:hypothetical protein